MATNLSGASTCASCCNCRWPSCRLSGRDDAWALDIDLKRAETQLDDALCLIAMCCVLSVLASYQNEVSRAIVREQSPGRYPLKLFPCRTMYMLPVGWYVVRLQTTIIGADQTAVVCRTAG
ncbi:hypothetical protein P280DRAFT_208622 [Massarina eburnea CBS 473.64]|uniref:Uncharacterized protein n=1 Tax=Massarina eburnea CBS 473.64 TaxID=1395130 RepID=A0A6A6RI43_9PLEO|nr:hypothetical protein P280DRAFT_208622 [Massarina eburnea CBS 473.64]